MLNYESYHGTIDEDYLLQKVGYYDQDTCSDNARIIADPKGGYWSATEGFEGDGDIKINSQGKAELNLFSPSDTSFSQLRKEVFDWYCNRYPELNRPA